MYQFFIILECQTKPLGRRSGPAIIGHGFQLPGNSAEIIFNTMLLIGSRNRELLQRLFRQALSGNFGVKKRDGNDGKQANQQQSQQKTFLESHQ